VFTVVDNVLTQDKIDTLLDWFHNGAGDVDNRVDVISKQPNGQPWPEDLVKQVLDQILDQPYNIDYLSFIESRISFRIHADSGEQPNQPLYKVIIIPLYIEGDASTVFFDNYYHGIETRFSREKINPFAYNLPNRKGKFVAVDDVRVLLAQCETDPNTVIDFDVTEEFIDQLKYIVEARSGGRSVSGCVTDYTQIENYQAGVLFDPELHQQYVKHIPIENLHGLTLDNVVPWKPGQAITFDRTQLHCAGSGHQRKIGISIFTNLI
jgi:hypothetical protein